jgi:two-component system LytT family response regulator
VQVDATCYSGEEALQLLKQKSFDLMLLDIEMPRMNGFQLLEQVQDLNFQVVFTTSFDQYAIKAIQFSALDYLLKPVDREELKSAVEKARKRIQPALGNQLELLLHKLRLPAQQVKQIALPTLDGLQMVPIDSIISCSASSNYSIIALKDEQKLTVSRTLKDIEEMLEEYSFLRVHHSYLVNLHEVRKYVKGEGGMLVMSDGSSIDVSRSKKEQLLKRLQPGK